MYVLIKQNHLFLQLHCLALVDDISYQGISSKYSITVGPSTPVGVGESDMANAQDSNLTQDERHRKENIESGCAVEKCFLDVL